MRERIDSRASFGVESSMGLRFSLAIASTSACACGSSGMTLSSVVSASRYTRRAVPLNMARFSSAEAPAAVSFSAFHRAAQPIPILSTGKLLSYMHRFGPKSSMHVSM